MEKIPEDVKDEIWANFNEYRAVYFATSTNDQPKVRPLTMVPLDSEFWVLTGTNDAKMKDLLQNPQIQVCMPIKKDEHTGSVRFTGKAIIVKDLATKSNIANRVDYFKEYWKTPDDPSYTLLKMEFSEIEYMKPGDNLAKKYSL